MPTLVLASSPEGDELLGATASYRKVSSSSLWSKAAFALASLATLLAALALLFAGLRRRRVAWPVLVALLTFVPSAALTSLMAWAATLPAPTSIAVFGRASTVSIAVFALTLALPVTALASLHAGLLRGGPRGARIVASLAGTLALVATIYLARYGWIGLRTWAL